jgi:hypothetical protein
MVTGRVGSPLHADLVLRAALLPGSKTRQQNFARNAFGVRVVLAPLSLAYSVF